MSLNGHKMFSKKITDVKKSELKIQDAKKDLTTRIKHLRNILENVDLAEAKGLFEANFSHIYHILYESVIQAETNLRQRELSFHLVHKAHKEELEASLWILDRVLSLLPELIHKRWQIHSLGRILSKLLHLGNSAKLRRQAVKFFLMWYQALNDNAPMHVHHIFASLVPGFIPISVSATLQHSVFHDTSALQPITPGDLQPILPPTSTQDKCIDALNKANLEVLLEAMVSTVVRLDWHDKASHHHRCFHFLLERFKIHYLPKLCPDFNAETSLYRPNLELPVFRKCEAEGEMVACRVALIMWVTNHMHQSKRQEVAYNSPASPPHDDEAAAAHDNSTHPSLDSTISGNNRVATDEEMASQIVREVLCSSRDNIDFIHELYRQAFLLNFNHAMAVRKTISMYKDLIQTNLPELPPYMLEPLEDTNKDDPTNQSPSGDYFQNNRRLRNDSYLGAIHKENLLVRAGLQNVLQLFMTHASHVFLLEVNPHFPSLLEEQTDSCKRVLNIYRYMVMHTRMDNATWDQLLMVLLQITSLVLGDTPPKKKHQSLGGKLAPAIFQTLIVTWIKANLNVMITRELWDRFLHVLMSLTHWEDLIKEWAKTLETLTRVLARHVYNLDLTDLPLDRLSEQKSKKTRRGPSKADNLIGGNPPLGVALPGQTHDGLSRQNSTTPSSTSKMVVSFIARSYSETNLAKRRFNARHQQVRGQRRSHSLDNLRQQAQDSESVDRTRSPSPAPSSGLESTSIKDTPMQLDVLQQLVEAPNGGEHHRGVVCGGAVRGWLPDVAVILWRRMLGALGDLNLITDPKLHAQVFEYLVKLTDTLIKMKLNQGVSCDNQATPHAPELVPPLTLILPWCFGALRLPTNYESGKLHALRLLCTVTLHCDVPHREHLPHFYRALHLALSGPSRPALNTSLRYLGPRFLSLQLPASSLLLLDLIHASNTVLNSSDLSPATPRTEAVSLLGGLLSVRGVAVLQPDAGSGVQVLSSCPAGVQEHVVSILLRAGRREPTGMARCIAITILGHFVYRELSSSIPCQYPQAVADSMNVILMALKFNNKVIAGVASNTLFLLCDHAPLLWAQYPRIADNVIRSLCGALFVHAPLTATANESDRTLSTALLLCLGEWCMRLGPARLLEPSNYGDTNKTCLLLLVFDVLHVLIQGRVNNNLIGGGLTGMCDDFDPNILLDDLDRGNASNCPLKSGQCQQAITLCARTVLAHLVTHLGHFPMAIGAARLSSLVVEHDDVPHLKSDELSVDIFSAPNIQLFVLTPSVIASLVELPALELPGGGCTSGLSTADKQVRVLLRDLSGKASWDASILYRTPAHHVDPSTVVAPPAGGRGLLDGGGRWGPMSFIQPESMMIGSSVQPNLQQRAMRHRHAAVLPDVANAAPDLDQLDDLLQYLGHTSPECLEQVDRKLNEPTHSPVSNELEAEAIASVISERSSELEQTRSTQHTSSMLGHAASRPHSRTSTTKEDGNNNAFQQCRLLFSQLGLSGWERRKQLHLLNKSERLLRELRNLDTQRCRETHKVAVIYVAPGQEDKSSILANQGGSVAYEQFLAALAWEVELEGHTGFLGGLQRQGSTGLTAPYVATSFLECIFHVATRMPGETDEAVLNKTRHLGNDEVHVVWSEHSRDYRRDIIPTEFCDVLITIYPLLDSRLNRVTIHCKTEVPTFGVLFNEAIVESHILAGVIRAAIICASRAKRSTLSFYQQYYEERSRSLETVVTKHRDITTYEDFISRVYSPVVAGGTNGGVATADPAREGEGPVSGSSMLSALLDSHSYRTAANHRGDHRFRNSDASRGVWFNNSENVELSSSISPRPLKKLQTTLKNAPRPRPVKDTPSAPGYDTPPDSPTLFIRRK